MMNPERWRRLNDVFDAALAQPRDARVPFVHRACGDDALLADEVLRLLDAHDRAPEALGTAVFEHAVRTLAADADAEAVAGSRLGPYRLQREVGCGGMGVVYAAERADNEYEKRVAIKLLKRGVDTDNLLRLFRHERQVLAGLDHPNITRLLDAGTADDGRPYFVMEYIEGAPIHEYCDAQALTVTERLRLFRAVCAAVSYAHHRLVVHRDLKPSNILVTTGGEPKLLDFGIAKLLGADGSAVTLVTETRAMTPEYASPEQLVGGSVTTQTDVYALGLVLFELLTGRAAFAATAADEPIGAAREVPRPSTVITAPSLARARDAAAAARRTTPERLARHLRGDLDVIVLKATHHEPARRYQSVEQLSEDVRRHLEGLPIEGRHDHLAYRAGRFIRRHRAAAAAAALVLASLVTGIAMTTWQAERARAAQARAERRFADVRRLANMVLFDYHDAIQDLPGATPVRERLVRDALVYLDGLAAESAGDPTLQRELAAAYDRVASVRGKPHGANLGDRAGALDSYRKALHLREALVASDPGNLEHQRELAESHRQVGWQLLAAPDGTEAIVHLRTAVRLFGVLAQQHPDDVEVKRGLARALSELGSGLEDGRDLGGALDAQRQAAALLEDLARRAPADARLRRSLSIAYENAGRALFLSGDVPGALDANRRAFEIRSALAASDPGNADYQRIVAISHQNDGDFRHQSGDTAGARESFRRKLAIDERLLAADPANVQASEDVAYTHLRLGELAAGAGDYADARRQFGRATQLHEQLLETHPSHGDARMRLAGTLAAAARTEAALGATERATVLARRTVNLLTRLDGESITARQDAWRAEILADVTRAFLALAARQSSARDQHCRSARAMFARSDAIVGSLRASGTLGAADAAGTSELAAHVERCGPAAPARTFQ